MILVWLGGPLLDAVQRLPFYSTNSITRAQSIFGFIGAVLAGIGIDRLVRGLRGSPRRIRSERPQGRIVARRVATGVLVLVVVLGFGALVVVRARHDAQSDRYLEHWTGTLLVPSLFVAVRSLAVLFTLLGPSRLRRARPRRDRRPRGGAERDVRAHRCCR